MNVLLIGKYPPCQGGISAKTYWLWSALAGRGACLDVVTLVPDIYRSPGTGPLPIGTRLTALTMQEPPWFLPGSDLAVEQLIAAALELASERRPHVVEANYLVPFGVAAFVVSRLLDVPLLLRHAGSDLAKLGTWTPARKTITALLADADRVVSSDCSVDTELLDQAKVLKLPRYVPDPSVFRPATSERDGLRLLLAGKLNYHWQLKAIDTILDALAVSPGWSVLAVADGIGKKTVQSEVERRGLSERVEWRSFVAPAEMPALLSEATAVWAVERPGGVPDFSNLVVEALTVGRPCLVAPSTAMHAEAVWLKGSHGLLVVDPDNPEDAVKALNSAANLADAEPLPDHERRYQAYIHQNARLYEELSNHSYGNGVLQ